MQSSARTTKVVETCESRPRHSNLGRTCRLGPGSGADRPLSGVGKKEETGSPVSGASDEPDLAGGLEDPSLVRAVAGRAFEPETRVPLMQQLVSRGGLGATAQAPTPLTKTILDYVR
jgi:hypothetical protein